MRTLWQDVRFGLRLLWKRPGFTAVALAVLALGVGANTAIFSVVNAVLLRPLPYPESERVVRVYTTDAKRNIRKYPTSYLNFADWRERSGAFEHVAAHASTGAAVNFGDTPESVEGVYASADLFPLLGVSPALGRTFTREEERPGSNVVVLSHGIWERRFGGDPAVVGRQFLFDGESTTVVGVMPEGFKFPVDVEEVQYWTPFNPETPTNKERGNNYLSVVARLKPGVSVEQGQAEMEAVTGRLEQEYKDKNAGRGANVVSMYEDLVGDVRPALYVLLGAVGFVLLIACANVANLLLARSASRQKEIAIRTALGAGRWRIVRQLLTESVILSLVGGAAGLLLALWGTDLLVAAVPEDIPRLTEAGVDARVLFFTLGVSVVTGLVFGLFPALQASRPDLNESLKEGERGSTAGHGRLRGALVVAEIAVALVLLVGAGLMVRSFWQLRQVETGFEARNVLTMQLSVVAKEDEGPKALNFLEDVAGRVRSLPGVEAVAFSNGLPFAGAVEQWLTVEGKQNSSGEPLGLISVQYLTTPDYFRALGIGLVRGRSFTEQDRQDAQLVAVIDERLAEKVFPGEAAIGQRFKTGGGAGPYEIVGVVEHVKHYGLEGEVPVDPQFYIPLSQVPAKSLPLQVGRTSLVVRTKGDPAALAPAVRQQVLAADPNQPVYNARTMEQIVAASTAQRRFSMTLLSIFAAVALVLAGVGIYGVMSYTVTQRTHEIGIRMALGARTENVRRLAMRQGLTPAFVGVVVGVIGALAATQLAASMLYGVAPRDPLTFVGVVALLVLVALGASWLPARRASRVDPIVALRAE